MNSKTTKRALLGSVVAMLVCFTMLLSTTFAWFTDTAVSASNKIVAGSLKIDLEVLKDGTWTSIKESKAPIFDYDKWEPGYTDVKVLKVENEGTLALKWVAKFVSATPLSDLANVIDVYVLPSATELSVPADRNLDGYQKVGTVAEFVNTIEDTTNGTLKAKEVAYLGIALKMQESAGNDYQGKDLGGAFDITIFATQETFEKDTFDDQYDVNAAFSVWDGTVPAEMPASLVVDGTTQTVHVKDAAAFAYLGTLSAEWANLYTDGNGRTYTNYGNGAGTNYYYSGQWTVSLEADIDLNNHVITPVDIVFGESTGNTAFKGNNYTIRNINTTTGLFANGTRADFSDLTLENVKATNGALSGSVSSTVTNVTVKNATISGVDYVGGLVGKTYGSVYDCRVIDSFVIATGKEAGGLIGYAETNSKGSTISGNTVKNVSVYANNRAAGLVAQPNVNIKVYNNTVDTVTVGAEDTSSYQPGAVVSNALDAANVYDNTVVDADVASNIAIASDTAELKTAVNTKNATVVLAPATYTTVSLAEGVTLIGSEGTVIEQAAGSEAALGSTKNTTIKNVEFVGTNAQRWGYAGGEVVFENCTFKGEGTGELSWAIHYDGTNGANITYKNCDIYGWAAIGGGASSLVFDGCNFYGNGEFGLCRAYSDFTVKNCTFDYSNVDPNGTRSVGIEALSGATVTIENCTNVNGAIEDVISTKYFGTSYEGNVILDGVAYTPAP